MQIIDDHSNLLVLWEQKQKYLSKLDQIAKLSILEPPDKKKALAEEFSNFIYSGDIDSLYGGVIIKTSRGYCKPLSINFHLAEILIAADQVLYEGKFSYIGKMIMKNIVNGLTRIDRDSNKTIIVKSQYYYAFVELPNLFSMNELTSLLDAKEIALLVSLSAPKDEKFKVKQGNQLLLTDQCSLNDAANKIDMPIKEAQILEFSARNKLRTNKNILLKSQQPGEEKELKNYFEVNSLLLVSVAKLLLCEYSESTSKLSMKLFTSLYEELKRLTPRRRLSNYLIVAGIELLQVNFKTSLLSQINNLIADRPSLLNTLSDSQAIYHEKLITLFVDTAIKNGVEGIERIVNDNDSQAIGEPSVGYEYTEILFLRKTQVSLNTELDRLRSDFNPYRFIFIVS